tara:strand:+ start:1184 stop:1657 length:474 start_codon:yes stop_codon:yes gene_type:complete
MSEFIRDDQERRAREESRQRDRRYDDLDNRINQVPARSDERDERESMARLADVVNDPEIIIDTPMMKSINDPTQVMLPSGEVAKVTRRMSRRGSSFPSFRRDLILPRTNKKRKKNPKLALAMKQANARGRKKNGGFKKGYDQARIAKLAQRLLKKMK